MKSFKAARALSGTGLVLLAATSLATSAQAGPVTTGLTVWLDAADPTGTNTLPGSSAPLATWVNKSATQDGVASVTQASPGAQPTLTVNGLNGLPVVQFNGATTATDFMQSTAFTTPLAQPYEVFMVWKANSDGQGASIALDGLTNTGRGVIAYEPNGTLGVDLGASNPNTTTTGTNTAPTPFTTAMYTTAIFNNGASVNPGLPELFFDGVQQSFAGPNGTIGTSALDGVTVGGLYKNLGSPAEQLSLDGYIGEVLIYNRVLSGSEQTAVQNYLFDKWFVPVPEPGSATLAVTGLIGLAGLASRRRRPA